MRLAPYNASLAIKQSLGLIFCNPIRKACHSSEVIACVSTSSCTLSKVLVVCIVPSLQGIARLKFPSKTLDKYLVKEI